jgi:hypothetical protein
MTKTKAKTKPTKHQLSKELQELKVTLDLAIGALVLVSIAVGILLGSNL